MGNAIVQGLAHHPRVVLSHLMREQCAAGQLPDVKVTHLLEHFVSHENHRQVEVGIILVFLLVIAQHP